MSTYGIPTMRTHVYIVPTKQTYLHTVYTIMIVRIDTNIFFCNIFLDASAEGTCCLQKSNTFLHR